jgi:hypothetical protein
MSGPAEQDEHRLPSSLRAFLQKLYRDPRYLLIGRTERFGRERVAFIEAATILSATGEVRGQALLNQEYFLEGRPDGERPHGEASLLDYYLSLHGQEPRHLDEDDIILLREESWQHYVRRNFAFQLHAYARARDDAEHNLGLISLLEHSDAPEEARWSFLRWWPWIQRDRAIAQALWDIQHGDPDHAATELYRAQRSIEQFARRYAQQYAHEETEGETLAATMCQHLQALVELLRRDLQLPVCLEEQLDAAAAREDKAEVARLRAELLRQAMEETD